MSDETNATIDLDLEGISKLITLQGHINGQLQLYQDVEVVKIEVDHNNVLHAKLKIKEKYLN